MISAAVKPALEADALTDICGANGAARMCSSHSSSISSMSRVSGTARASDHPDLCDLIADADDHF